MCLAVSGSEHDDSCCEGLFLPPRGESGDGCVGLCSTEMLGVCVCFRARSQAKFEGVH